MKQIPFAKPDIDKKEIDAAIGVMNSGWLTTGPKVKELEEKFAEYVGAKYAVAVSSGTAALFLSLKYHIFPDEQHRAIKWMVPSLTFTASAAAILHAGYGLEFVDVDDDMQARPHEPERMVSVHLLGGDPGIDGPMIVHDCAHHIERNMCKDKEGMFCYSFYPTKNLASAEGGMIATNSEGAVAWLRLARSHGQTKDNYNRYAVGGSDHWEYSIAFPGWKMNMTDIQAAIAIVQLGKLDRMNKRRQEIVHRYNTAFGLKRTGLHLYPIEVSNRSEFISKMYDLGVSCSVHFLPLHLMPAYREYKKPLPKTETFGRTLVSLPLYSSMTDKEVDYVIKCARECL